MEPVKWHWGDKWSRIATNISAQLKKASWIVLCNCWVISEVPCSYFICTLWSTEACAFFCGHISRRYSFNEQNELHYFDLGPPNVWVGRYSLYAQEDACIRFSILMNQLISVCLLCLLMYSCYYVSCSIYLNQCKKNGSIWSFHDWKCGP